MSISSSDKPWSLGLIRWALGSVASKVARQSEAPVLVIRTADSLPAAPASDSPLIALVALDGSPVAEASLVPATQLIGALAGNSAPANSICCMSCRRARCRTAKRLRSKPPKNIEEDRGSVEDWLDARFALHSHLVCHAERRCGRGDHDVANGGEDTEGSGPSGRCAFIALTTLRPGRRAQHAGRRRRAHAQR